MAFGRFLCGLSQFHRHISWLVREVALTYECVFGTYGTLEQSNGQIHMCIHCYFIYLCFKYGNNP